MKSTPAAPVEARRTLTEMSRAAASLISLTALLGASLVATKSAAAADLVVRYDQSQLLRMPRAVTSVIIGNPSIADVTIQSGNVLVVTGKTFGMTNIIALDSERNIIQDQRVIVRQDEARTVNLTKGGLRQSYSCTPECAPTLTIGDDPTYFDMIQKHAQTKTKFSAEPSGNSQQQPEGQ